jgi:nicotinate-nucleotide pyrophosphorylase (carboxylating)
MTEISDNLDTLIDLALAEDVGPGDFTTLWTVPENASGEARIVAKAPVVISGVEAARRVFRAVDETIEIAVQRGERERAAPGETVMELRGRLRSILTAERTALNFLGRLSGTATLTAAYVEAVAGTGATVIDTRKTTPGFRLLEKAAVRAGGGGNHRIGLHDMVMVKDNHIAAAGGVDAALRAVSARNDLELPVEVEVRTLDELDEALAHAPDRILLDNMSPDTLRSAVARVSERFGRAEDRPELEASGNITLETIRGVAETGVDLISVGALTHSAPTADLSLRVPVLER